MPGIRRFRYLCWGQTSRKNVAKTTRPRHDRCEMATSCERLPGGVVPIIANGTALTGGQRPRESAVFGGR